MSTTGMGYLKKPEDVVGISGSPLIELRVGRGLLIASEMMLDAAAQDPVAGRLLAYLTRRLGDASHDQALYSQVVLRG